MTSHWYALRVIYGGQTQSFIGTSPLDEDEFASALAKDDCFIKLENLIVKDQTGIYKSYNQWDPAVGNSILINPKFVVVSFPMPGDPQETTGMTGK
jgi:hypothetical protein